MRKECTNAGLCARDTDGNPMLRQLRDRYSGARIAIIGSAPSAVNYAECDCVATIAVNGAARLLHTVKNDAYFLSGDARAPMQSWYCQIPRRATQLLRPMAAIFSQALVPDENTRRELIRDWIRYLDEHPAEVRTLPNRNVYVAGKLEPLRDLAYDNPFYEHLLMRLGDCSPHALFNVDLPRPLSPDMEKLRRGVTSAGCALQIAYLMGAKEICMFGVEMSNNGVPYRECNYFYTAEAEERGVTTEAAHRAIEALIGDLQRKGLAIAHCGPTRIRNVETISPRKGTSFPAHAESPTADENYE